MSKGIVVLWLTCFLLAGITFAADSEQETQKKPRLTFDKSLIQSYSDDRPQQATGTESLNRQPLSVYRSSSSASPGVTIGATWYEMQHSGSMGRMIAVGPRFNTLDPGGVHFGWMYLPGAELVNRSYAYNYYNAATGLFNPLAPTIPQLLGDYAGYVNIDITADNKGIIGGHNNQGSGYAPHLYWDVAPFTAFYSSSSRVPDAVMHYGQGGPGFPVIWPKIAYQEGTQTVTHVIAQESNPNAVTDEAIYYFRKIGEGANGSWDPTPYVIDTVHVVAHDIAVDYQSDKVALLWLANLPNEGDCDTCSGKSDVHPQWDNDVYYQISNDQGLTWQPRVNLTQNVNGEAGFRPYTELNGLFDTNGFLHILWPGVVWSDDPIADWWGYNCRLFHWSENTPYIRQVHNADFDQTDCTPGAWSINVSQVQLSECDGKLYALWVQYNDPNNSLDDCADRADGGSGSTNGAVNGELYLSVSDDDGLTWDYARNLTQTYTPDCLPGVCASENWPSMTKYGRQVIAGEDWSSVPTVDPSGSYTGDHYLHVQYVMDSDPGAIVQDEGTWQLAEMKYFRMACVEPQLSPIPVYYSPVNLINWQWYDAGVQHDRDLTITNNGNTSFIYTVSTYENNGPSGWLSVSNFSGTVLSGINNTETGMVHLNTGGIQTTDAILTGGVVFTHNGIGGEDTIKVELRLADGLYNATYDTLFGGCLALGVSSSGATGHSGVSDINLDWNYSGLECDSLADVYLYSGGPLLLWENGLDTFMHSSFLDQWYDDSTGIRLIGGHCRIEEGPENEFNYFISDTMIIPDSSLGMIRKFIAPVTTTDCGFVIQYLKVWSYNGSSHSGIRIGEAVDWDIPTDSGRWNSSGFDFGRKLIYQQGEEYPEDCDNNSGTPDALCSECGEGGTLNNQRFGGLAFHESYLNGSLRQTNLYGAYTAENDTFIYPYGNFVPYELYLNMDDPGYTVTDSTEDIHTVMCYEPGLDIGGTDYYEVVTILATVREGTSFDLGQTIDDAIAWMSAQGLDMTEISALTCNAPSCCEGIRGDFNGSGLEDISDLLAFVDYFFIPGAPPPVCFEEADVNGSGLIDISDLLCLVDYFFNPFGQDCVQYCPGYGPDGPLK